MDRLALEKRKKRPKSGNEAPNAANPHVVSTPQDESTNDRFSASSWLAAEPLPRRNRGSREYLAKALSGWRFDQSRSIQTLLW